MQPLPETRHAQRTSDRNTGLVFNKFVDQWPSLTAKNELLGIKDNKGKWLDKFSGASVNSSTYAKRIKDLAEATNGMVENFTTTGPFVIGMGLPHGVENGFLWYHTLGCPYLPGSSIKGMIRAWVESWLGEDVRAGELFGRASHSDPSVGHIIIHDAIPTGTVTLYTEVITPHSGDWRLTGETPPSDWLSPTPIPFLAVKAGAEFQFAISLRSNAEGDDLEDAFNYLKEALEWIGAGAKTAVGFGRFSTPENIQLAKQQNQMAQAKMNKERERVLQNAPPSVGDDANHDEWGLVTVKAINGDMADVYSRDEGEDTTVPLSELKKR